jgi:transposase
LAAAHTAGHQKKAKRIGAYVAFIDECGVLMAPTVQRTWAPRGETPILRQRGRSHTKVSIIGAILARPGRRGRANPRTYFRIYRKQNFDAARCREFLRQLLGNSRRPVIVVWDRLNAHRSVKVKKFVAGTNGRLSLYYFPPYAPDLNPMEFGWGHLKGRSLANVIPLDEEELFRAAKRGLCATRSSKERLLGFIDHAGIKFFD